LNYKKRLFQLIANSRKTAYNADLFDLSFRNSYSFHLSISTNKYQINIKVMAFLNIFKRIIRRKDFDMKTISFSRWEMLSEEQQNNYITEGTLPYVSPADLRNCLLKSRMIIVV
jgi:hypothetical protein